MNDSGNGILGSVILNEGSSLSMDNSKKSNGFLGLGTVQDVNVASGNYSVVIHRTNAIEICVLGGVGVLHSLTEGELGLVFQDMGRSYIIPVLFTSDSDIKFIHDNIPPGYTALVNNGKGGVFVSQDGSLIIKSGDISLDFISEDGKAALVTKDYIVNSAAGRIGMQSTDDSSEYLLQTKYSPKDAPGVFVFEDRIGSVDMSKYNMDEISLDDLSLFEEDKDVDRLHYYSVPSNGSVIRYTLYSNPKISSEKGSELFSMFSGNDFSRSFRYTMDGSVEEISKYQYGVTGDLEHDVPAQSYMKEKGYINGSSEATSMYNSYFGSEEVVKRETLFVDQKSKSLDSEIDLPGSQISDRNTRVLFDWNAKKIDNYILKKSNFSVKDFSTLYESISQSEGGRKKYSRSRMYIADDGFFVNISIQMLFGVNDKLPPQIQSEVAPKDAIYTAKVKWMVSGEDIDNSVGMKSGYLEISWAGEDNNYLYKASGSAFVQTVRSKGSSTPVFVSRELINLGKKDAYVVSGGKGNSLGLPVAPDKREKLENEFIDTIRPDLKRIKNIRFEDQINNTVKYTQFISQIKHSGDSLTGSRVSAVNFKTPAQSLGWYTGKGYRGQGYYPEKTHFSDIDLDNDIAVSRIATMIDPYYYAQDLSRLADAIYVIGAYLSSMMRPTSVTDKPLTLPLANTSTWLPNGDCLKGALTRVFFMTDYNKTPGFAVGSAIGVNKKDGIAASNNILLRIGRIFESKKYDAWASGGAKCPSSGGDIDLTNVGKDVYDDATRDYDNNGFFGRAGAYLYSTAFAFTGGKPAFPGFRHMFGLMKKLRYKNINSKYSDVVISGVTYRLPDFGDGVGEILDDLFEVE